MPRPSRWNEIVESAARIFQEKGFASTSLEDIATEVGMWKGSLYHYINSKEDLLFAVVREPADKVLKQLREIAGLDLPPSEQIRLVAQSHGALNWMTHWYRPDGPLSASAIAEQICATFLNGIVSRRNPIAG